MFWEISQNPLVRILPNFEGFGIPMTSNPSKSRDCMRRFRGRVGEEKYVLGDKLGVEGDADAAVEAGVRVGWSGFRQLVPLFANKDISLSVRGGLCSSCVQSSMLHGNGAWPVREGSEVALRRAEMGVVGWMCGMKLRDGVPGGELRDRLGLDDMISVLQQSKLQWCGHVLQGEDGGWVRGCVA